MNDNKSAYLVGIGGAGLSGLARYLHTQGYRVCGADPVDSHITESLKQDIGATIYTSHRADNIPDDCQVVVYSPAVPQDNPEREQARIDDIANYSYPEYLGEISKQKHTIAIAGTNGKTTTTTMVATALDDLGIDPTVIVGGTMPRFGANFVLGSSDIFVVEACEYKDSFLSLEPNVLVITNITPDHLDYFGDMETYIDAFKKLIDRTPTDGVVITNNESDECRTLGEYAQNKGLRVVDYAQYTKHQWNLSVPGQHNILNAAAALCACLELDLETSKVQKSIEENFQTTDRRFQLVGMTTDGAPVYDDYAHNPEGITLLLEGVKEKFHDKTIVVAFHPHLFSRTQDFFDEFVRALTLADALYLLPIYPAREKAQDFDVSSVTLADAVMDQNASLMVRTPESIDDCVTMIESANYHADHIIITVGAGEGDKVARKLTS